MAKIVEYCPTCNGPLGSVARIKELEAAVEGHAQDNRMADTRIEELEQQLIATDNLMRKAHEDHCRCEQERAKLHDENKQLRDTIKAAHLALTGEAGGGVALMILTKAFGG